MTDYTQITDFGDKDALAGGDPEKTILGADIDAELVALAAAIASKLDSSGYTAADVLTKLKTVDGAGSGLDADSVDGVGPVAVGTYTPTITETTNVDSSSASLSFYLRIGSIVFVIATFVVNATAGSTPTEVGVSLPVASNLGAATDLSGFGAGISGESAPYPNGNMTGDASNNRAKYNYGSNGVGNTTHRAVFAYRIL